MTTAEHQTHEQFWRELEGYAGVVAAEILEETEDEDENIDNVITRLAFCILEPLGRMSSGMRFPNCFS